MVITNIGKLSKMYKTRNEAIECRYQLAKTLLILINHKTCKILLQSQKSVRQLNKLFKRSNSMGRENCLKFLVMRIGKHLGFGVRLARLHQI